MTLAMALISYVAFQVAGISAHGVWGRIKHMANPPFLLPIEIISELSRIVSLSFRLFGNIFAGETLLTVMYGIANAIKITVVGLVIPVIFLYLEVLFGFIQALIFAVLTLIYIALASAHEHEEEHEAEGHHRGSAHDSRAVPLGASGD
jgi:F-type H+-transporting ATPase subunit a